MIRIFGMPTFWFNFDIRYELLDHCAYLAGLAVHDALESDTQAPPSLDDESARTR